MLEINDTHFWMGHREKVAIPEHVPEQVVFHITTEPVNIDDRWKEILNT